MNRIIMNNKSLIGYLFAMLFILAMASFNVFYHLGQFPIYSWDEARHGVSAFEMVKNHNYIVNTYRGKNDYWNLKPPLSFWTIILGYKLVGFNALGLRFCSAIFAILTFLSVAAFVHKRYGKIASLISTLVLSTSTQLLINHSSRTGDADSLFVFLFTIAILALLLFNFENKWWIYVSGLAFALAFLTKSWHAGNIVIIMGAYLLITKKFKHLTLQNWLILLICMLLPIIIWGILRFQYDGFTFFEKMINYDLLHRSTSSIEGHVGGIFYYVSILRRFFLYWILIFILLGILVLNKKIPFSVKWNTMFGVILWVLVPFILFTIAKTKVRWYILPIYPPLSIIMGVLARNFLLKSKAFSRTIILMAILSVSVCYESQIVTYLNNPPANPKQSLIDMALNKGQINGDSLYIYHSSGSGVWLQSEVLTAELSDNLHVKNGSFQNFLTHSQDLLLVPKKMFSNLFITKYRLKLIASNQWGYLINKSG